MTATRPMTNAEAERSNLERLHSWVKQRGMAGALCDVDLTVARPGDPIIILPLDSDAPARSPEEIAALLKDSRSARGA